MIRIADTEVLPGNDAEIKITLEGNPGITTIDFLLEYDNSVMELKEVQNGTLLKGFLVGEKNTEQPYYLGWINSLQKDDCTADGTLATLIFYVKEEAKPGSHPITIRGNQAAAYNAALEKVVFSAVGGNISVRGETSDLQEPEPDYGSGEGTGSSADPESSAEGGTSAADTGSTAEKRSHIADKFQKMKIEIVSAKYSRTKHQTVLKYRKSESGIRCPKYQIWRSTKKSSGYRKIYTTSKTTFVNKKVTRSYYYKVRGVRNIDGKVYYTRWSGKAKVSING
ncbi:MAG: cohesin domain-containing protein [Anaerovoracaceae bacterium]